MVDKCHLMVCKESHCSYLNGGDNGYSECQNGFGGAIRRAESETFLLPNCKSLKLWWP